MSEERLMRRIGGRVDLQPGIPSKRPVVVCWHDDLAALFKPRPQNIDFKPVRPPCGRIAAFGQHKSRGLKPKPLCSHHPPSVAPCARRVAAGNARADRPAPWAEECRYLEAPNWRPKFAFWLSQCSPDHRGVRRWSGTRSRKVACPAGFVGHKGEVPLPPCPRLEITSCDLKTSVSAGAS